MKIPHFTYSTLVVCYFCFFSCLVFADQEIDFSDQAMAEEIFLNTSLTCVSSDEYFTGPFSWRIEEVNGKKVRGFTRWCREKAIIKGKLKKNILNFNLTIQHKPNCNISGKLKFYKGEYESVNGEGQYRYTCNLFVRYTYN